MRTLRRFLFALAGMSSAAGAGAAFGSIVAPTPLAALDCEHDKCVDGKCKHDSSSFTNCDSTHCKNTDCGVQ